jgi:hypothetical protein
MTTLSLGTTIFGTITGEYVLIQSVVMDQGTVFLGGITVGQGKVTRKFWRVEWRLLHEPDTVFFIFHGQSLEISGSGMIRADNPGSEGGSASIQLLGLEFTAVPEPTYFRY